MFGSVVRSRLLVADNHLPPTAIAGSFTLIILHNVIADISFWIVPASPEVEHYARSSFFIRIFAAPVTLAL
ncbi:MAG TPA: hypothetical protein VKA34_01140 [Balneolales bacterium]|nr:hypothetical protein [Balneolales bacterium]